MTTLGMLAVIIVQGVLGAQLGYFCAILWADGPRNIKRIDWYIPIGRLLLLLALTFGKT
jgi:hypothetical protein